jgi:5-methylcytosine-specific restriction protein A
MQFGTIKPRVEMLRKPRAELSPVRNARIRGSTGYRIRDQILTRDAGVCQCARCIRDGAVRLAHEVDHVVPIWAGGRESDDNRAAINRECHRMKTAAESGMRARGAFDPEPWSTPCLERIAARRGA